MVIDFRPFLKLQATMVQLFFLVVLKKLNICVYVFLAYKMVCLQYTVFFCRPKLPMYMPVQNLYVIASMNAHNLPHILQVTIYNK